MPLLPFSPRPLWLVAAALLSAATPTPTFVPGQPETLALGGSFVNAVADIDADGDLDLFVGFGGAPNRLYRNDAGRLVNVAPAMGVDDVRPTRAAAWGDFDADGDPDLLVGFAPGVGSTVVLYRHDGKRFVDVTAAAGLTIVGGAVRQPVWVDVDGDDDLDLFVAFRDRPNALFRNESGQFVEVAARVGLADARRSVGAAWADVDADGDLDVVVANQDGDANALALQQAGQFVDGAETAGVAWGGRPVRSAQHGTVRPCIEDVDNDGALDLFFANYGPNGLFLRDGAAYRDVSTAWGVAIDGRYDACAFADVDHDGRLDLYVNGTVSGGRNFPDYLFVQRAATLRDTTPAELRALRADHGVVWFDLDGDGTLELALTGAEPDGMHQVLRHTLRRGGHGAVSVRVVDGRGHATRAGAEVRVFRSGTRERLGTRIVDAGSGYNTQHDQPVTIGTGTTPRVDVEVTWPNGRTRVVVVRRGIAVRPSGVTSLTVAVGDTTRGR